MLPSIKPSLDPFAQRAAIDALEAQRAAYRRFARTVDDQTQSVSTGDADRASAATAVAARGFDELDAGAQALRPHLDRVREQGSPDQQSDMQRRLETLSSDADRAQSAIQNLTAQLDAWRIAYGRQLASVGITPGGASSTSGSGTVSGVGSGDVGSRPADRGSSIAADPGGAESRARDGRSYGPRGQAAGGRAAPTLLNRLG